MANIITKEQIKKVADDFNSAERAKALHKMEEQFYNVLEESLQVAEATGKGNHYRWKYIHLPEFFKGQVPEEFKELVKAAGFSYQYKDGNIQLM